MNTLRFVQAASFDRGYGNATPQTSLAIGEGQPWKVLDQVVILYAQQNPRSVFPWKKGISYPSICPQDWPTFVGEKTGLSLFRVKANDSSYLGFRKLFKVDYENKVLKGNHLPTEVILWKYFARPIQFPKTLTLTQDNQSFGRHCTLSLGGWTLLQEEDRGKSELTKVVFELGYRRISIHGDGKLVEGDDKNHVVLCSMP